MKRTPLKPDSIRTVPGSVLRGLAEEIKFVINDSGHREMNSAYTTILLQRILALLKAEEKQ